MGQGSAPGPSMGETAEEGLEIMCICLCASVWNDALSYCHALSGIVGVVQPRGSNKIYSMLYIPFL